MFSDIDAKELGSLQLTKLINSYSEYYIRGENHTSRAKKLDLQHFLTYLRRNKGVSKTQALKVRDWDFVAVQGFVDDCLAKGESPATVARRLATLKHMGRTLAERIPAFTNPTKEVRPPRVELGKPKALSTQELKQVKAKAKKRLKSKSTFIRLRNQMLLEFFLETGLRADEIRNLRRGQLDEELQWVKNVRTKAKRYRNVYLTSTIRESLASYLDYRRQELMRFYAKLSIKEDNKLPLFVSGYNAVPGNPDSFLMGTKSVWRAINEFSTSLKLHPHLLRHSFAIDLLDSTNDIRLVSQALGHSDVKITMRYTERKEEALAEALEAARKGKTKA